MVQTFVMENNHSHVTPSFCAKSMIVLSQKCVDVTGNKISEKFSMLRQFISTNEIKLI